MEWAVLILMEIFQNGTTEMNHTTDGFLSSILNDEDLQLMDMAMNEGNSRLATASLIHTSTDKVALQPE